MSEAWTAVDVMVCPLRPGTPLQAGSPAGALTRTRDWAACAER